MLILTRQNDERVFIDMPSGRISVTIVEIRGSQVRLGFEAPREFEIHRDDIKKTAPRERSQP